MDPEDMLLISVCCRVKELALLDVIGLMLQILAATEGEANAACNITARKPHVVLNIL